MPRPPRLSPDEIAAALHGLPHWQGDGDGLHRTVKLPSFRDAVAAIGAIADVAEEMDHHPDIDLRWRMAPRDVPCRSSRTRGTPRPDRRTARRAPPASRGSAARPRARACCVFIAGAISTGARVAR